MPSTLAWLDHSESQRKRMLEVVKLFEERDTIDDLGLGSVRDTFSDLLFPGTSVLMTRARYLLFVPWVFQRLEDERVSASEAPRRARRLEVELIYSLLEGGESEGIIGRQARENLKQLPSSAYWGSLGRFRIRTSSATRSQVLATIERRHRSRRRALRNDDGEALDDRLSPWHAALPPEPDGLFGEATFALSLDEAEYLRDRLRTATPGSALAFLLSHPTADVDDVWEHPAFGVAPERLRETVNHARLFSEVILGAPLLYNLLLARASQDLRPDAGELVDEYEEDLDAWADRLVTLERDLATWDQAHFWQVVDDADSRVPDDTITFVRWWFEIATDPDRRDRAREPAVQEQIEARELAMKRSRARLRNRRQLERWGGAIGTGRLQFRWPTVQQIIADIVDGARETN